MGDLDRAKCRCVSVYGVIIHTDGHSIREPLGAPKRGVRIVNGPADLKEKGGRRSMKKSIDGPVCNKCGETECECEGSPT